MEFTDKKCMFCENESDNYILGSLDKEIEHIKELLEEEQENKEYFGDEWNVEIVPAKNIYTLIGCSQCGKISTYIRYIKGFVSPTVKHPLEDWD